MLNHINILKRTKVRNCDHRNPKGKGYTEKGTTPLYLGK